MILNIRIEDQDYPIEVPDDIVADGGDYFQHLDQDMDKGWQMSRDWVDKPNTEQRCQIVADRILGANQAVQASRRECDLVMTLIGAERQEGAPLNARQAAELRALGYLD